MDGVTDRDPAGIDADPTAIGRGAGRLLAAALALAESRRLLAGAGVGDVLGGAHDEVRDAALGVLGRLGEVVEADADRLYRAAFAVLASEARAATRIAAGGGQ